MHDGREANISALLTEDNWYRISSKVSSFLPFPGKNEPPKVTARGTTLDGW